MDVSSLTNQELRKALVEFGENPGPVVATTRQLYEKKLQDLITVMIEKNLFFLKSFSFGDSSKNITPKKLIIFN